MMRQFFQGQKISHRSLVRYLVHNLDDKNVANKHSMNVSRCGENINLSFHSFSILHVILFKKRNIFLLTLLTKKAKWNDEIHCQFLNEFTHNNFINNLFIYRKPLDWNLSSLCVFRNLLYHLLSWVSSLHNIVPVKLPPTCTKKKQFYTRNETHKLLIFEINLLCSNH